MMPEMTHEEYELLCRAIGGKTAMGRDGATVSDSRCSAEELQIERRARAGRRLMGESNWWHSRTRRGRSL